MESSSEARDHAGIVGSSAPARRLAPKLAFVAVFGALSALSVAALVGQTPSALLHGGGDPSQISVDHVRAPTPDLIAGHTGWCVYQRQSGTGACAPVAPPLSIRAAESGHAACAFQPIHLRGLTAHWGEAVVALPRRNAPADALLSCATSWYSIRGNVLLAAILLHARNPSVSAPAPPRLIALRGRRGMFTFVGSEVVMRRIGKVWLAVQGGTLPQRLTLVRLLQITGSALTWRPSRAAGLRRAHSRRPHRRALA